MAPSFTPDSSPLPRDGNWSLSAFTASSDSVAANGSPALQSGTAETPFRILVTDDQEVTRMRLQHLLEREGYEVVLATSGQQTLEMVRNHNIDLVLTDVAMPIFDGLKTTRFLRQTHSSTDLPVIVMTASKDRDTVLEAFAVGANDYIRKPIDNEILLARLGNQLLIKKAQNALRESEERYSLAAQGTNDGIWDWNLTNGELYLSPRWREMVGISPTAQLVSNEWMSLIHVEDRDRVTRVLESHLCGDTPHFETELRMQDKEQDFRWMLCRGLAFHDAQGIPCRIAGSLTDITNGKVADALTGLPNRVLFQDRVERVVAQIAHRSNRRFAVIYMDVDNFKLINDHMGHRVGDQFLVAVAKRIDSAIRKSDSFVARLGGDEFAVVVEAIDSVADAIQVARRIDSELSKPFQVADREILTRASMGIAVASHRMSIDEKQPLSAEMLVSQADAAMYRAKKQTQQAWCVFESQMLDDEATILEMGHELRLAINRDEFSVHYQPIVDIANSKTIGFEALIRWQHPVRGAISPVRFIPIAEANGMIVEIGEWILMQACQQAVAWEEELRTEVMVSVNVSIRQINGDFLEVVNRTIRDSKIKPHLLRLEVTETVLIQDTAEINSALIALRELGIHIGIDDFGTGYSSLAYLHKMPVDILKIDRSFIDIMTKSEKHHAIVRTIVMLAESLNLKSVAEGIETRQQMGLLRELGCHMGQGFLFSKPCLANEAKTLIKKDWSDY